MLGVCRESVVYHPANWDSETARCGRDNQKKRGFGVEAMDFGLAAGQFSFFLRGLWGYLYWGMAGEMSSR